MFPNPEIYGIPIHWYSFLPKLALVITFIFGYWYYLKALNGKLSFFQVIGIIFLLFLLMLSGGRAIGMIEYYLRLGELPHWSLFFASPSTGKFRWCGSLLIVLLCFPYLARKLFKIKSVNALLDMLVLCFCVFRTISVLACHFSGDGCYGTYTNLPWGCNYAYGIAPTLLAVHPTPTYNSIFTFFFFTCLLNWDLKHKKTLGATARIYFLVAPTFYILLELIRINPEVALGISLPQLVHGIAFLISIPIFKKLLNQEKRKIVFLKPDAIPKNNNNYSKSFLQRHRL